ncbi:hypothetical protein [Nocardioides pacificus]
MPTATTNGWYGDTLTPLAWLDDDTVLFTVIPKDAAKQYLVTWDVDSGELARVTCWPQDLRVSFATDLLRGRVQG